ncbi:hypothetical protein R3P38DRAFT_2757439 [Favolaschia claudopus]|uniref:Uncharacterized protein n=1 Tax=Favolaschia claudopus TaxID=2862362 RepID=A0AAW0EKN5_9AGAR
MISQLGRLSKPQAPELLLIFAHLALSPTIQRSTSQRVGFASNFSSITHFQFNRLVQPISRPRPGGWVVSAPGFSSVSSRVPSSGASRSQAVPQYLRVKTSGLKPRLKSWCVKTATSRPQLAPQDMRVNASTSRLQAVLHNARQDLKPRLRPDASRHQPQDLNSRRKICASSLNLKTSTFDFKLSCSLVALVSPSRRAFIAFVAARAQWETAQDASRSQDASQASTPQPQDLKSRHKTRASRLPPQGFKSRSSSGASRHQLARQDSARQGINLKASSRVSRLYASTPQLGFALFKL